MEASVGDFLVFGGWYCCVIQVVVSVYSAYTHWAFFCYPLELLEVLALNSFPQSCLNFCGNSTVAECC